MFSFYLAFLPKWDNFKYEFQIIFNKNLRLLVFNITKNVL